MPACMTYTLIEPSLRPPMHSPLVIDSYKLLPIEGHEVPLTAAAA